MAVPLRKHKAVVPRRRFFPIEPLEARQLLSAVVFTVNPALSSITVGGTIQTAAGAVSLMPQAAGGLTTSYSGTIDADVEASSIQFTVGSSVAALNNGTWNPGAAAGNYGAVVAAPSGSIPLAIRNLVADGTSGALPIATNGSFSSSQALAITGGELDYTLQADASESLVGLTANNTSTNGSYTVSNGVATLVLPFSVTYTTTVLTPSDTQLTLTGKVVATAGAPTFGASISGNVHGSSPLQNVKMYNDANNDGVLDGSEISTTTDTSGNYTLSGLKPGAAIVRQILPAGFKQVSPSNGFGNHITLAAGQSVSNSNFTDATAAGTISGTIHGGVSFPTVTVYTDLNNNGKPDSSEHKTTTGTDGSYMFTGLNPGTYIVRQILPAGYQQVTPTLGYGVHVTLASGRSISNANFNDTPIGATAGSISGTVFSDDNGDGKINNGEAGLSNWELYIDQNNTHVQVPADPSTTTDTNGFFDFTGLAAGTYIVRVNTPGAWLQTFPLSGFGQHITLFLGQNVSNVLFGQISDG
jgi:uncharacterized protein (DUF2141 family)